MRPENRATEKLDERSGRTDEVQPDEVQLMRSDCKEVRNVTKYKYNEVQI